MSRESPRFLTLGEQRVFAAGEAIYAVKLKHVFACRPKCFHPPVRRANRQSTAPPSHRRLRYEGTGLSARGLHFLDRIDNDIRGVPTDALVAHRSVADTIAIPIGQSCRGC